MSDLNNSATPFASHMLELARKPRQLIIAELDEEGKPIPKHKVEIPLAPHQLVIDVHLVSPANVSPTAGGPSIITPPAEIVHLTLSLPDGKGGHIDKIADIELERHSYMIVSRFKFD